MINVASLSSLLSNSGDRVEIKLNDHLLGPAFDPPWLPYKFLAKAFSIPMGTLRQGSNTLRLATADAARRGNYLGHLRPFPNIYHLLKKTQLEFIEFLFATWPS